MGLSIAIVCSGDSAETRIAIYLLYLRSFHSTYPDAKLTGGFFQTSSLCRGCSFGSGNFLSKLASPPELVILPWTRERSLR